MSEVSAFDDADEAGEDGGVEQVNEERTHHRHNQEGFVRRAESLGNGLHIGNGGRRGAQTQTAGEEMAFDSLMVFTGNANPELAHRVAKHLDTPLGNASVTKFSDGLL